MKDVLFVLDAWGGKTTFDPASRVNFNREQLLATVTGADGTAGFHVDRFAGFYQTRPASEEAQQIRGNLTVTLRLASGALSELVVPDFLSTRADSANHLIYFQGAKTLVVVSFDYFYYYSFQPAGRSPGPEQRSPSVMTEQERLQPGKAKIHLVAGRQTSVPDFRELDQVTNFSFNPAAGLLLFTHQRGEFGLQIDMLRSFEVGVAPPQAGDVIHKICQVTLTPEKEGEPETIHIADVIKESWDTANGLLMIYGKEVTLGCHLDHVISYQV